MIHYTHFGEVEDEECKSCQLLDIERRKIDCSFCGVNHAHHQGLTTEREEATPFRILIPWLSNPTFPAKKFHELSLANGIDFIRLRAQNFP